jgi:hypothetical protein
MLLEGRVFGSGANGIADNTPVLGRFTKHNALSIADVAPHFYEYAIRGKAWYFHTAATGVAPGTAIGTTAAFALFNAKGSGVNVIVLLGSMGVISGTLGAGTIDWCTNVNLAEAVPTGTAITARPAQVGGAAPGGANALTTATLAATPNPARVFGNLMQAVVATTALNPFQIIDLVDGAIVIPPGGSVSLQATAAAGSTPLVVYSALVAEEPI